MQTKKFLVAYDESKPDAGKGDFLAVVFEANIAVLLGLRSRRIHTCGRVVFIGRDISEKDVFAKLVDTGRRINNVDETLEILTHYLQELGSFKIGNIVTLVPSDSEPGFKLVKVADMPKMERKRLP